MYDKHTAHIFSIPIIDVPPEKGFLEQSPLGHVIIEMTTTTSRAVHVHPEIVNRV